MKTNNGPKEKKKHLGSTYRFLFFLITYYGVSDIPVLYMTVVVRVKKPFRPRCVLCGMSSGLILTVTTV